MNSSLQVGLMPLAAAWAPVPFVGLPRPGVAVRSLNCMALVSILKNFHTRTITRFANIKTALSLENEDPGDASSQATAPSWGEGHSAWKCCHI